MQKQFEHWVWMVEAVNTWKKLIKVMLAPFLFLNKIRSHYNTFNVSGVVQFESILC